MYAIRFYFAIRIVLNFKFELNSYYFAIWKNVLKIIRDSIPYIGHGPILSP
jgi:hypothetical protein